MPNKLSGTATYQIWRGMKRRCYLVSSKDFAAYGGSGVVVCSGWKSSFASFLDDMGERPSASYSIDRIDNDGNYSCGHCEECVANGWVANCRWATRAEQRRNQSDIRMLTFQGVTLCMSDWAKRKGMTKGALFARLKKMSVEAALREPVREWKGDRKFHQVPEFDRDAAWRRDKARRDGRAGK